MRKAGLAVNAIVLLLAVAACFYAANLAPIQGTARVTALDRAGVFNEAKLQAYSPPLAENLRYNVANWIQEKPRSLAVCYSECLAGLAVFNIAILFLSGRLQPASHPAESTSQTVGD